MSCCGTHLETGEVKYSDYSSEVQPTWCGGCGNFGIWAALKRALVELKLAPHDVLLCFDVGCNGNMNDKIGGYRLHSLHGRVLPLAAAAKLANPKLKVIAMAGDGATYSEGINHFVNSVRNNFPITFFVHDNGNYGLTTGQASATTPQGAPRTANPAGPTASTLNPLDLAFALQPSFVARGFSGNIKEMVEIMKEAITWQEKGFGFVDLLQACPTYNKETTHMWYQARVRNIKDINPAHDTADLNAARMAGQDLQTEISTGILYKNEQTLSYSARLTHRTESTVWQNSRLIDEVKKYDVSKYLQKFV